MKYQLRCTKCGYITPSFGKWFEQNQACPKCGCKHAEADYFSDYTKLPDFYKGHPESFWHYFDFLPLENKENIVSCKEGAIPIESWDYLSKYAAEKFGIDCKVYMYRNDLNGGTHTFKDVAGSMAASILKENGVKEYCVASTGNTATAFSKYLSLAGIHFTVFVPNQVCQDSVEEMQRWGQTVVISKGNYAQAKKEAADFSKEKNVLISAGNIDPIRVEAKKTMVFEFMRQLGKMPDVYFQAVAGGTGPIAVDKGVRDVQKYFPEVKLPRMLLVQQDLCDPMVRAWEAAEKEGFPEGFEKNYPVIEEPKTKVSILSTGNPGMYPVIAPIVKKSKGTFIRIKESDLIEIARRVRDEKGIYLGPASIVCLAGFYQALENGCIKNGETVLLNCGEGCGRACRFKEAVDSK